MINRHNYEEFFLMYIDNELTPQQRETVELFLRENPDLQKEFAILQQIKLAPDEEIRYEHKTDLLKIKESIGIDNYQDYFLLYIDNELNESSKEAVETFVLQHPELQDEFTLLKQTVLPVEKIVFHHKKLLYRKEERRVIVINWMRVAVAAAIIGAGAFVWWLIPENKTTELANVPQNNERIAQPDHPVQHDTSTLLATAPSNKMDSEKKQEQKNNPAISVNAEYNVKQAQKENNSRNNMDYDKSRNNEVAVNTNPEVPTTGSENTAENVWQNVTANTDPAIVHIDVNNVNTAADPLEEAKSINAVNTGKRNNLIQPVTYRELNTDEDELNNAVYIGNMEINKNAVRGFMKKVGGLFSGKSKNASDEKGKLQIASFELNTN